MQLQCIIFHYNVFCISDLELRFIGYSLAYSVTLLALLRRSSKASSTLATIVAEIGDYCRQCGRGLSLNVAFMLGRSNHPVSLLTYTD